MNPTTGNNLLWLTWNEVVPGPYSVFTQALDTDFGAATAIIDRYGGYAYSNNAFGDTAIDADGNVYVSNLNVCWYLSTESNLDPYSQVDCSSVTQSLWATTAGDSPESYTPSGSEIEQFGSKLSGWAAPTDPWPTPLPDDTVIHAAGIAIAKQGIREGWVYLVDSALPIECALKAFNEQGQYQTSFTCPMNSSDQATSFANPYYVAVDPSGYVYVVDQGIPSDLDGYTTEQGATIYKFTPNLTLIGTFGGLGNDNGKFVDPKGIAADPEGNIYVADTSLDTIQVFAPVDGG